MSYTTPAMLNAMKKTAYDSENGCTAEPSESTIEKARKHSYADRLARSLGLSIDDVVAPSAEDEFFASLEKAEDEERLSDDYAIIGPGTRIQYSNDLAPVSLNAALTRENEPKGLGNAHYGAAPRIPESKAEAGEEKLYGIIKWRRDGKNAKLKKLKSKESIRHED